MPRIYTQEYTNCQLQRGIYYLQDSAYFRPTTEKREQIMEWNNKQKNNGQKMKKKQEYKHIEITMITIADGCVHVTIANQTHRGENFGEDKNNYFTASNGVTLTSELYPQIRTSTQIFVRGTKKERDETILIMREDTFLELKQAIKEYNNKWKKE